MGKQAVKKARQLMEIARFAPISVLFSCVLQEPGGGVKKELAKSPPKRRTAASKAAPKVSHETVKVCRKCGETSKEQ